MASAESHTEVEPNLFLPPASGPSSPANANTTGSNYTSSSSPDRLGFSPSARILTSTLSAFVLGAALGVSHGGSLAALRFRAENSHRLPTARSGWYFYHRAKNVYVLQSALSEGLRMGARLAPWVGLFFLAEHALDEARDDVEEWDWKLGREVQPGRHKDFLATTVAGLSVAGGFAAWRRMAWSTSARMCKLGLVTGLGFGLVQDGLKVAGGGRLAWVDLVKRGFGAHVT